MIHMRSRFLVIKRFKITDRPLPKVIEKKGLTEDEEFFNEHDPGEDVNKLIGNLERY